MAVIPFRTWLSQIVGYCQFVADDFAVRRAWMNGDYSKTSITSFDELYEQIFDDLDSDVLEKDLSIYMSDDSEVREALAAFLEQIRYINTQREHNRELSSTAELLASKDWVRLVEIARRVVLHSSFSRIGGGGSSR